MGRGQGRLSLGEHGCNTCRADSRRHSDALHAHVARHHAGPSLVTLWTHPWSAWTMNEKCFSTHDRFIEAQHGLSHHGRGAPLVAVAYIPAGPPPTVASVHAEGIAGSSASPPQNRRDRRVEDVLRAPAHPCVKKEEQRAQHFKKTELRKKTRCPAMKQRLSRNAVRASRNKTTAVSWCQQDEHAARHRPADSTTETPHSLIKKQERETN